MNLLGDPLLHPIVDSLRVPLWGSLWSFIGDFLEDSLLDSHWTSFFNNICLFDEEIASTSPYPSLGRIHYEN